MEAVTKGLTNQPLTILVDTDLMEHPVLLALQQQGHSVYPIHTASLNTPYDLILSRKAWRWDEGYDEGHVKLAMAVARKGKRNGP